MERICPHCGKSSNNISFAGEFCIECALENKNEKLPKKMQILICPMCGRVRKSGEWIRGTPQMTGLMVRELFKKFGFLGRYDTDERKWHGIFKEGGEETEYEYPFEVEYRKEACPTCSRSTSGYFEGLIQLRGETEMVKTKAKRLIRKLEKKTFIPKIEEMHGGMDIYLGFKKEVPDILRDEGLKFERTEKLAGERHDGKRIYRTTFLVRLEKK